MVIFGAYSWVKWGFPGGSAGKESACNAGDLGSTLGWEDPLEKGKAPLQYSGLENSMDCMVHGVTKSRPHTTEQLSLSLCFLLGGGRDVTFLKVRAGNPLHILEV